MSNGIVYMATGEQHIRETKHSVDSLRTHMPDIPVTLITDRPVEMDEIDNVIIKQNPNYDYSDGIIDINDIPYNRTLRLDSDTYICDNFSEIFTVLDEFDFGASVNPGKTYFTPDDSTYVPPEVPRSFPLFNGGVLLFKKNNQVKKLFETWKNIYYQTLDENPKKFNQPSLWEALYKSDVRLFPLPRQYNCFIIFAGCVSHDIKILHGRHPNQKEIAKRINSVDGPRCYDKSRYPISVSQSQWPGDERFVYRLKKAINQSGIISSIRKKLKFTNY